MESRKLPRVRDRVDAPFDQKEARAVLQRQGRSGSAVTHGMDECVCRQRGGPDKLDY